MGGLCTIDRADPLRKSYNAGSLRIPPHRMALIERRISVHLPPELRDYLEQRVRHEFTTTSDYVRRLVVQDRDKFLKQQRAEQRAA